MPENSGLAYVVVVHLSPNHESQMANLLQPHMNMSVQQVTKTLALEPNHVYVIPPGSNLNTIDTHLRLTSLEEHRRERAPIDHFFRTLASTHDGNSVGVILTGTGSDGTLGIKEIKGKGGLTIVQDPSEAEYDGMPQSALTTGMVDLMLPIAKIPEYILRFASTQPKVVLPKDGEKVDDNAQQILQKIFAQIRSRTGRDFSRYKRSTIMRRIQHRMQLSYIEELEDYLRKLREQPEEVQTLSNDFLITVTNFFRDAGVFKQIEQEVIPELFNNKDAAETVRVWSVGCATGEEAYSLAMLLLEEAGRRKEAVSGIQVFASDLHDHSLRKAREGFYPGDIEADVSQERLRRFFIKDNGGYRIRKEVREVVVFASHNLLGDPPFSRIDLIVCRNVLIYLQREVQRDVIDLFHYALRPEGFLLLGSSETLESTELFRTENKGHCLFRKRNVKAPDPRLPVFPFTQARSLYQSEKGGLQEAIPIAYGVLHQQIVERHAPPSLLVSPDFKVVHLSERVGRYLVYPGGEVTSNIFRLVRQEFTLELRTLLHSAKEEGKTIHSKAIPLQLEGVSIWVTISVYPAESPSHKDFMVVVFNESKKPAVSAEESTNTAASEEAREQDNATLHELQTELDYTRQRLQAMVEEYETTQEEMKASNEEMQSTNEELRSTLEELETSKEELQSMNEELTTLNQENKHKVEELTQLSGDLNNLLMGTEIATIFLDRDFRIMRFTPRVGELFNVRPVDRGRPLSDLTHRLGYDKLLADARQVLAKLTPLERKVQDNEQRWYLTRVLPYRSANDRIEGVVITFVEITRQKQAEQQVRKAKNYAEQIVASVPEPLMVLTPNLEVQTANQTFYDTFKVNPKNTEGQKIYNLGNGQWNIPSLRKLLEDVLPQDNRFQDYEIAHTFENIGHRTMSLSGRRLEEDQLIILAIQDVTELKRKQSQEAMRENEALYRALAAHLPGGAVYILNEELRYLLAEGQALAEAGLTPADFEGKLLHQAVEPHLLPEYKTRYRQALEGKSFRWEHQSHGRYYVSHAVPLNDAKNDIYAVLSVSYDITEQKQAEEALQQSEEHLRLIMESATDYAIFTLDLEGKVNDWNAGAEEIIGYSKDDIIGQPGDIIFTPKDRENQAPEKEMQKARAEGRAENERWHLRKDGTHFWGSGAMMPLLGKNNELRGFLKIMTDNTERMQMEEALKHAKEEAEKAAKAKEEFLAHMSHEIRTPLNAILGLSTLLLEQNPQPSQIENLHTLKFSANNLKILINDILDFSKIQAGKLSVEENDVDLRALLHSLQKAHELRAREQENTLKINVEEQLPEIVRTDHLKLSQVLNNLISNAVKFTRNGEVKVAVSLDRKKGRQLWINFSVSDTGTGIPKEKLTKIFDAFTQADNTTKRAYEGTGLGLSITQLLLEHMGSKINVESEVGKGSRFFFTLPMKVAGKAAGDKSEALPAEKTKVNFQKIRLLLVEDMEINRKILVEFLNKWWDLVPDEAENGKRALEMAQQNQYDLILMDVRMPIMDGYQAAAAIRSLEGTYYKHVPIIALTADTAHELEKHKEAAYFTDVLTKPFDPNDLQEKVIRYAPKTKQKTDLNAKTPDKKTKGKRKTKKTGRNTSRPSTLSSPDTLNTRKLEAFFKNKTQNIKQFLHVVLEEFTNLQQQLATSLINRNVNSLDNLKHKSNMLFDLLDLKELEKLLDQCQTLLQEDASQNQIDETRQKVEVEIAQISASIEKYLEERK